MTTLLNTDKIAVVILAAGEGKRMQSDLPKVMHLLRGQPLIEYVVEVVEKAGLGKPVVVVSAKNNLVQDYLGNRATYVAQAEQKGTGHAAQRAESVLKNKAVNILVLYGDMPLVTAKTLQQLVSKHEATNATLTLATTTVSDFSDWRLALQDFGRIIRGPDGKIIKSVETKDATPEELKSKELNPCIFVFKAKWLWPELSKLKAENSQGEQYLTDLLAEAVQTGEKVTSVAIEVKEAIGVNTNDGLSLVHSLVI